MSAKQSSEMRHALLLVASGMPVYKAAVKAGVYPSSIYKAMIKKKLRKGIDRHVA